MGPLHRDVDADQSRWGGVVVVVVAAAIGEAVVEAGSVVVKLDLLNNIYVWACLNHIVLRFFLLGYSFAVHIAFPTT